MLSLHCCALLTVLPPSAAISLMCCQRSASVARPGLGHKHGRKCCDESNFHRDSSACCLLEDWPATSPEVGICLLFWTWLGPEPQVMFKPQTKYSLRKFNAASTAAAFTLCVWLCEKSTFRRSKKKKKKNPITPPPPHKQLGFLKHNVKRKGVTQKQFQNVQLCISTVPPCVLLTIRLGTAGGKVRFTKRNEQHFWKHIANIQENIPAWMTQTLYSFY